MESTVPSYDLANQDGDVAELQLQINFLLVVTLLNNQNKLIINLQKKIPSISLL